MRVFEIILVVLLAVTLKSLIVPQASIASNVVHIVYKLIQAVHRPMHKTKESDIAGINGHRAMYRLATMMEPKFPVPSEKQRIQMEDGRIIPIEILRPEKCKLQLCPVVLWFHGGGFVIGDTDMYRHVTTAIAEFADVVVIAVTYRLAPEHKFPSSHVDCLNATSWVYLNAEELHVDRHRLGVTGDSAGGNLAAIVAAELRDMIVLSIPIYPAITFHPITPSQVENSDGILLPVNTMLWFNLMHLGAFNTHLARDPLLNPTARGIIESPESFPRVHVVTAELDILRDEGEYYVDYLRKNGVSQVSLKRYNNTHHGFFASSILAHGRTALLDVCLLIKEELYKTR